MPKLLLSDEELQFFSSIKQWNLSIVTILEKWLLFLSNCCSKLACSKSHKKISSCQHSSSEEREPRVFSHFALYQFLSRKNVSLKYWIRIGNLENSLSSSCAQRHCLHKHPKVIPPDKQLSIFITCHTANTFVFMWQIHNQSWNTGCLQFLSRNTDHNMTTRGSSYLLGDEWSLFPQIPYHRL